MHVLREEALTYTRGLDDFEGGSQILPRSRRRGPNTLRKLSKANCKNVILIQILTYFMFVLI